MRVLLERPPFFAEIDRAFGVAGKPVIFAWGDTIYNPQSIVITPELEAHEKVHLARQGGDPLDWWTRYIADPAFRLSEELPAHRAEFAKFCTLQRDRNRRAMALHRAALRLSSPLYGRLVDYREAKALIGVRP